MDPMENKRKLTKSDMCSSSSSKKKKVDVGQGMKIQNDFGMFLAEKVISTVANNTNFVFSPASINIALTMVAASGDDNLKAFMLSFLRSSLIDELNAVYRDISTIVLVDGSKNSDPKISAVNGVWMEQTLHVESSLKDLFKNFFKATFSKVDFRFKVEQVREEVNAWVLRQTSGLIKDIIPLGSVHSQTTQIYGNALYFKGAWQNKFDRSLTMDKKFHLLNGTSVYVPFMTSRRMQFIEDYDGFKVLRLPIGRKGGGDVNRHFYMYLYLPDAKNGLNNLVKRIASTPGFLDSHIPKDIYECSEFRIPKFKTEFGFEASKSFAREAFDELKLQLYHKACVEIDEDGVLAAPTPTMSTRYGNLVPTLRMIKVFVADHPFLFVIREDKTGTVLFVGQIFDLFFWLGPLSNIDKSKRVVLGYSRTSIN